MKRIISFALAALLLLGGCAPTRKTVTREQREGFFNFSDEYRLDLMKDFKEGEAVTVRFDDKAPFAELIDYRTYKKGKETVAVARYVLYDFPELELNGNPKEHPHYEWAKETVINGETEGFAVKAVADLTFYLPQKGSRVVLISKKTLE